MNEALELVEEVVSSGSTPRMQMSADMVWEEFGSFLAFQDAVVSVCAKGGMQCTVMLDVDIIWIQFFK